MQLRPNRTKITATVIEVLKENNFLKIVILTMPSKETLPAFLWVGKSLQVNNQSNAITLLSGDIISAEIEVLGDPFKQTYMLHDVVKIGDAKQHNL